MRASRSTSSRSSGCESLELLQKALAVPHDLGVSIALDDVTSGYGTLKYCSGLAPRWIKVDSEITRSIGRRAAASDSATARAGRARGARRTDRGGHRERRRPRGLRRGGGLRGPGLLPGAPGRGARSRLAGVPDVARRAPRAGAARPAARKLDRARRARRRLLSGPRETWPPNLRPNPFASTSGSTSRVSIPRARRPRRPARAGKVDVNGARAKRAPARSASATG